MQDKSQKMGLLDKLIKLLDDGSLSDVKSAKIVAGKEPELTNLVAFRLVFMGHYRTISNSQYFWTLLKSTVFFITYCKGT